MSLNTNHLLWTVSSGQYDLFSHSNIAKPFFGNHVLVRADWLASYTGFMKVQDAYEDGYARRRDDGPRYRSC